MLYAAPVPPLLNTTWFHLADTDCRIGLDPSQQLFESALIHLGVRIQYKNEFACALSSQQIYTASESIIPE